MSHNYINGCRSLKHSWQELGQELHKLADLHSEQVHTTLHAYKHVYVHVYTISLSSNCAKQKNGVFSSAQFKHVRNGEGLEPRLHVYDIAITVAVYSTYIIV